MNVATVNAPRGERCHDVLDLMQTIVQFNKLEKIEVGGSGFFRRELDKRFDHWSIRVEISEVGESFDFFSDFFNFTFKLDPTSTLM